MNSEIIYIEYKGEGIIGPARIGRVTFSKTGRTIYYKGRKFQSLKGKGFKANYFDVETKEEYWITGCRKDGGNALYNADVEIDEDVLETYWCEIRNQPEMKHLNKLRASGKHRK